MIEKKNTKFHAGPHTERHSSEFRVDIGERSFANRTTSGLPIVALNYRWSNGTLHRYRYAHLSVRRLGRQKAMDAGAKGRTSLKSILIAYPDAGRIFASITMTVRVKRKYCELLHDNSPHPMVIFLFIIRFINLSMRFIITFKLYIKYCEFKYSMSVVILRHSYIVIYISYTFIFIIRIKGTFCSAMNH